jgi:hypothetical protein
MLCLRMRTPRRILVWLKYIVACNSKLLTRWGCRELVSAGCRGGWQQGRLGVLFTLLWKT